MAYFTYILKSKVKDRYYIGFCENLNARLEKHNSGNTKSTKAYIPWEIVYWEKYHIKKDAIKREKQLKKLKSKKYIDNLIKNHSGGRPD